MARTKCIAGNAKLHCTLTHSHDIAVTQSPTRLHSEPEMHNCATCTQNYSHMSRVYIRNLQMRASKTSSHNLIVLTIFSHAMGQLLTVFGTFSLNISVKGTDSLTHLCTLTSRHWCFLLYHAKCP